MTNTALNKTQTNLHQETLLNLLDVRGRLMLVDPQSLTLDQHIDWNDQMFQVGQAIIAMERAILTSISDQYAKKLPQITKATEKLENDLHKLKAANDVIGAVSAALGTITSIVTLLA
jgi:hypothetical protein